MELLYRNENHELETFRVIQDNYFDDKNGKRDVDEDEMDTYTDWEDEDVRRDVPKRKRKREDLDYRRMETLEFEDDEYSYYVEATPKRGGR